MLFIPKNCASPTIVGAGLRCYCRPKPGRGRTRIGKKYYYQCLRKPISARLAKFFYDEECTLGSAWRALVTFCIVDASLETIGFSVFA